MQNIKFPPRADRKLGIIILCLGMGALVIWNLSGCARTVTSKVPGNQIVFTVTFRGNLDTTHNRYYLVLGDTSLNVPYPDEYFFAPGENYDENHFNTGSNLAYYYTQYFNSWDDFVTLNNDTYYVSNGPFATSESHAAYQRWFLSSRNPGQAGTPANQIILTIFFNRLSHIPANLYFNFLAVNGSGYLKERLEQLDNNLSSLQGSIISGSDPQDSALDASLDILSWNVVIE